MFVKGSHLYVYAQVYKNVSAGLGALRNTKKGEEVEALIERER